jgi:hypothetical protein
MIIKYKLSLFSLFVFSIYTFAGETGQIQSDLTEIKAAERQHIIDELSYRLDKKESCDLIKRWSDSGSGADRDGNFYIPAVENNVYIIGGFGAQSRNKSNCVTTVSIPANNPADAPVLLVTPIDWKMIWNDEGSGADKDGSMWEAISPDGNNYRCIGTVPQAKHKKPDVPNYRCVHNSLTEKIVSNELIWSDIGSNAAKKVTMLKLPNTNSFIAVPDRVSKIETYDLKADPVVRPDPKRVDEILASRMAKIEEDLKAGMQDQLAQKQQAEAAEKKRLAEEAEKKQLAQEAEQKLLAEAAEKKRLAEAAKQKPVTEESGQKPVAAVAEKAPLAEQAEPVAVAEEPRKTETVPSNENTVPEADNQQSSGLNSFYVFLLKVFGTAFVAVLFMGFIVYKLMSKKNKTAG